MDKSHKSLSLSGRGQGEGMKQLTRQLRSNQTDAEQKMWTALRGRRFFNFKFRRQHSVDASIVDFCCLEARLIIEIDGGQHAQQRFQDQRRTQRLNRQGYQVLRFWNHEVLTDIDSILEKIRLTLEVPHPSPLPKGEGDFASSFPSGKRKIPGLL